jgi:hypothetical protein
VVEGKGRWVGFELAHGMGGWVDGWMSGWVDLWIMKLMKFKTRAKLRCLLLRRKNKNIFFLFMKSLLWIFFKKALIYTTNVF